LESESPADAGNTGRAIMDLEKIMAENPAIAAQVREMQRAEYERGKSEAREQYERRVSAVAPYLKSEAYGDDVKQLAADVLAGTADPVELRAYVRAIDGANASHAKKEAQKETIETGSVPSGDTERVSNDGTIASEADYQAQLAEHKAAKSGGAK